MEESKEVKGENTVNVNEEAPSKSEENKSNEVEKMTVDESPSGSTDLRKTLPEDAFNNFIQGKRHMLVHDYTSAVQSLATACELYVKHFGELALECGEVYFLYGKSLIRLGQQSGVLGDAINKVPGTIDEEEEEGESSEEEKENEDQSGEDKDKEKNGSSNGSPVEDEAEVEEKEPSESTDSPQAIENNESNEIKEENGAEKENKPETDVSPQNETAADETLEPEEDDFELAWNSLETAKTIFSRQGEGKEARLKVAEILQLLAEISMETDNYPAAINDLKSCLCIQRDYLDPDDRLLAHTYYEMGLAHMMQKMYDEALDNFTKTLQIFQLRRDNLEKTPVKETVGGFEAADRQKEIEEVDGIITDIREKIEDTKELVRNATTELQETKQENEIEVDEKPPKSENSNRPVTNITHLLKRKKPDEDEKESETKRIKISNGEAPVKVEK